MRHGMPRAAGAKFGSRLAGRVRRLPRQVPAEAAEFERRAANKLPGRLGREGRRHRRRRQRAGETVATRKVAADHRRPWPRRCRKLLGGSADPDRLEPHQLEGLQAGARRRARIQWGNHVNYGVREFGMSAAINGWSCTAATSPSAALPDLLRLQPQRAARGRADEGPVDLRVHPRFDRPGRGRPDPPVDRARRQPAPDPESRTSGARPTRSETAVGLDPGDRRPASVLPDLQPPEPAVQQRSEAQIAQCRQGRLRAARLAGRPSSRQDHPDRRPAPSRLR